MKNDKVSKNNVSQLIILIFRQGLSRIGQDLINLYSFIIETSYLIRNMNIKKKPQALQYGITRTQANYQVLMLDAMNKLIDQTRQNNNLLTQLVYGEQRKMNFTPQINTRIHQKASRTGVNFNPSHSSNNMRQYPIIGSPKQMENEPIEQMHENHQQSTIKQVYKESQYLKNVESNNQTDKNITKFRDVMEEITRTNKLLLQKLLEAGHLGQNNYINTNKDPEQFTMEAMAAIMEKKRMKKYGNYGIIQEIMPFSDKRQIKVRFKILDLLESKDELSQKFDLANFKRKTTQWVGMVFRATTSICWNMMLANHLNFQQTKILFTENIIYNFIEFMNDIDKYLSYEIKLQLTEYINTASINVLEFLCKQYPQTKVQQPNIALRKAIPIVENNGQARFNLISMASRFSEDIQDEYLKIQFLYREDKDYSSPIMKTINYMIDRTDQQFQSFQNIMTNIFSRIYIPKDKRKGIKILQSLSNIDFQYRQKVKAYSYYVVGRKIAKNTPKYTQDEIKAGLFFVKSPAILRIITKWLEQLWQFINSPLQKLINSTNEIKHHNGKVLNMGSRVRKLLFQTLSSKFSKIKQKIQLLKIQFYNIEHLLTNQRYTLDQKQIHLSQDQLIVGKYCSYLKNAISSCVSQELSKIIYYLLKIPLNMDIDNLQFRDQDYRIQARKHLDNVNLVSLNIFDLLRCKCYSNEEEIISIVETLKEFQNVDPNFQIIRVKDRLNQGTRDILINAQYNRGMVWQIQLAVSSHSDVKQNLLDKYNHFLYELKRSRLGSLSECVSIWSSLEQRSIYFQQIVKKKRSISKKIEIKHYAKIKECSDSLFYQFKRPMICHGCKEYFSMPLTSLLNVRCQQCRITYCGQCFFQSLNEKEKKNFMFRNFHRQKLFSEMAIQELIPYTDYKKPFPKEGFFIKKNFLNKELCYYKAVITDKCDQSENQYEIHMVRIKIQDNEVSIRTMQKKFYVIKKINDEFYFKNPDQMKKTQLNNLWIYYFNKKPEHISLKKLQAQMKDSAQLKTRYLVCLFQPNFTKDIKILDKTYEKNRLLMNLKQVEDIEKYDISIHRFPSFNILNSLVIQEKQLQILIVHKKNKQLLKQLMNKKITIINIQNQDLTNEMQYILNQNIEENVSYCSKIQKVDLSNNNIRDIKCFKLLNNLMSLIIPKNYIMSLQGIQKLILLNYLKCDQNQITSLVQVSNLTRLTYFSANINKITSVKGLEKLKQLKNLALRQNNIESLEGLHNLQKLKSIFLQNNPVKDITPLLSIKLTILSIGNTQVNPLQVISLKFPEKLTQISLRSINLSSIPNIFANLKNLIEINLSENHIKKIENISECQQLLFLDLNHNEIQQIQNLQNLIYLECLMMKQNKVKEIKNIKYFIESLKILNLQNNPLECINEFLIYEDKTGKNMRLKYSENEVSKEVKEQLYNHSTEIGNRNQNY